MKIITKAALGGFALIALGAAGSTPADAASFGFSFGPGPYYGGAYYADPCFRPYRFRPGYCLRPAPYYGYYGRPYWRPGYYGHRDFRRPYWRRWR
jgi:hypothetical protein